MAAERGRPTRRHAFVVASAIAFVIMAVRFPGGPLAAAAGCEPEYDPSVSTPAEVIPRYPHREATTDEIYRYFEVVDSESDRVENGVYGTSWLGRPLIYSLVTDEDQLPNVAAIAADQQRLRDPRRTTPEEAARIAAENPAIAWYAANVHGGEESGGDASLQILYELAARIDCEAEEMLRELVVGIIPTQNPDGRDLNTRQNAYGFDMNRDWFARTQPEIDAEMDLLRQYPPVVFVDAHENNGTSFFFPPNADPVHHEISEQNIDWIYHMYGPALAAEFQQRGWRYYNHDGYDFFAMEYGDTVPTTVFMSAGMTFEKGNNDTAYDRWLEQWVAGWTTLETAAENREEILREYYDAYVTALEEGEAGELEPNRTYQPGQELDQQVPNLAIRHYFLPPETSRAHPETATLAERLLDTDVEVYRLERNLSVPDLQFYGRTPSAGTVPAGSFWIPMAQPQKHWIQALLGEDPYISVFGSYDVTSWSNPLLLNLDASFSGAQLDPAAKRVLEPPEGTVAGDPGSATYFWFPGDSGRAVAAALLLERSGVEVERLSDPAAGLPEGAFVVPSGEGVVEALSEVAVRYVVRISAERGGVPAGIPFRQPKIAVYDRPNFSEESFRHLRWTLEQFWEIPYTGLTGEQVQDGELATGGYDVFVIPGVTTRGLGSAVDEIREWIEAGGVYVGTERASFGGTHYAVRNRLSSSKLDYVDGVDVPGTLFRVEVREGSPVTLGAPDRAYWFNRGEQVMTLSLRGENAVQYPEGPPEFWYSGYARGGGAYRGTAVVVDESVGSGHVVLFSGEPHYRGWTEGTMLLLANALAYPAQK